MYRFRKLLLVTLLLLLFAASGFAQVNDTAKVATPAKGKSKSVDSTVVDTLAKKVKEPKPPYIHQLRFGVDIARIGFNLLNPDNQGYGVQADYALRKNIYIAAQAGFGRGKVDYPNLKYNTTGFFVNAGIEKSFLDRLTDRDFDMAFIGVHYGLGAGNRQEAEYLITSVFGKEYRGTIPAKSYTAHWGEVVAGIKLEVIPRIFAGWNINMRFLLNSGSLSELAPNYIPGYGKGDQSVAVDLNFFVSYAIRWGSAPPVTKIKP